MKLIRRRKLGHLNIFILMEFMYEQQIKPHVFQLDWNFKPKQFDYGIVPTTMKSLIVEQYQ